MNINVTSDTFLGFSLSHGNLYSYSKCDCSDASFGYPGGPILFKNLNFGIDLDSRIASKIVYLRKHFVLQMCNLCLALAGVHFYHAWLCHNNF